MDILGITVYAYTAYNPIQVTPLYSYTWYNLIQRMHLYTVYANIGYTPIPCGCVYAYKLILFHYV